MLEVRFPGQATNLVCYDYDEKKFEKGYLD